MSEKKNKPKKEITAKMENRNISKSQEKKIVKKVKKDLKADGQNDE